MTPGFGGLGINKYSFRQRNEVVNCVATGSRDVEVCIGIGIRNYVKFLILSIAIAMLPLSALAQSEPTAFPENAHAKRYSEGWECDVGYHQYGEICVEIDIPANAYANNRSYGSGWECEHGYRRANGLCKAILVPNNAHLNSNGDGWTCNRLYQRVNGVCEAILAPENGFLVQRYGYAEIACDWGFRLEKSNCVRINVPANARLTDKRSEVGWICLRGFRADGKICKPILVPKNAYLSDEFRSIGWKCERGFRAMDNECEEVVLPENSHLNRVGDGWDCNRPYIREQGRCVIEHNTD